jgi:hypothetical protein
MNERNDKCTQKYFGQYFNDETLPPNPHPHLAEFPRKPAAHMEELNAVEK